MNQRSDRSSEIAAVPSTPGAIAHIPALDGLRGVAILMVMVFHYHLRTAQAGWAGSAWDRVAGVGSNGVGLFFVLSGFLITGILWQTKNDQKYLCNFYARRVLRISPLYYGALFVGLVLLPNLHPISDPKYAVTVRHQLWLWTYTSNFYESWTGRALPLFGHFWSLAVEEQFYLVWPFIVLWSSRRMLAGICALCFVGAFAARLVLLNLGADPALAVLRLTPCNLDSLVTGAFLAEVWQTSGQAARQWWRRRSRDAFLVSTAVVIVLVLNFPELIGDRHVPLALCNSLFSIFFGAALLWAIAGPSGAWLQNALETRVLRTVGKYSYGLYVFHWPLGRLWLSVMEKWRGEHPNSILGQALIFQICYILLAAGSSLLMAWLSWHCYERQFLRLKRYFAYQRRSCPPIASPVFGSMQ